MIWPRKGRGLRSGEPDHADKRGADCGGAGEIEVDLLLSEDCWPMSCPARFTGPMWPHVAGAGLWDLSAPAPEMSWSLRPDNRSGVHRRACAH